jgi:23S rRNA (adenine2503-C2)-methyltransferase
MTRQPAVNISEKLVPWAPAQITFSDYMSSALPAAQLDRSGPQSFYGLTILDLEKFIQHHGKEKYRAQQLYKWVYEKKTTDFEQMSNLSKDFRSELKSLFTFDLPKVLTHLKSVDGTQKFLFDMGEGQSVEAVLIPSDDRMTLCISSEIGCNMACRFCFTGKQKLKRRLRPEEIVGQFLQAQSLLPEGWKITNIVFMGMGEPLDNPESVFKTIEILSNDWGINFSRRKITVSTSGIVPEMWRVAASKTRLAVSLNGYSDESRSSIMPINKRWDLLQLLNECRKYNQQTKDLVTFEYVLLKGITDQISHAKELYSLTRGIGCKINIIPFNEHPGSEYSRPDDVTIAAFQKELMRLGAHVLLRRTMGRDIFAACGQLTSAYKEHPGQMDISNSTLGGKHVTDSRRRELGLR